MCKAITPFAILLIIMSRWSFGCLVHPYQDVLAEYGLLPSVTLNTSATQAIFNQLFFNVNCTAQTTNCSECMERLVRISETIGGTDEWSAVSVVMLYAILDLPTFCKAPLEQTTMYTNKLLVLFNDSSSDGLDVTLDEQKFNRLFTTLFEKYQNVDSRPSQCFGKASLLYDMGLQQSDAIPLNCLASHIMSAMIRGLHPDTSCSICSAQKDILESLFSLLEATEANQLIGKEGFDQILTTLSIGSTQSKSSSHIEKRSIEKVDSHGRNKRSLSANMTGKCFSESDYLAIYGLDLADGINREQFIQLCPSLIQQRIANHCVAESDTTATKPTSSRTAEVYGYGTIAVFLITSLAVIGAVLIPCLSHQAILYVLSFMIGLGVGTLFADALIHLVPEVLGAHDDSDSFVSDYTIKQLIICTTIFLLFVFEILVAHFRPAKVGHEDKGHGHSHGAAPITWAERKKAQKQLDEKLDKQSNTSAENGDANKEVNDSKVQIRLSTRNAKAIPTASILLVLGEAIHKAVDGIAVGAAFNATNSEGVATAIAVFCHEVPHGLSNFAMLMSNGLSPCKALMFNLLASLCAFIGLYIGCSVGSDEVARQWIFCVTIGLFVYIALVDMMPELLTVKKEGKQWLYIVMKISGLFLGIGFMFFIAVLETLLDGTKI